MLNINNESPVTSNNTLLQENIVFHYKIEKINMLIAMVARRENKLWVKVSPIHNSARR
jgi:hypothetical protein